MEGDDIKPNEQNILLCQIQCPRCGDFFLTADNLIYHLKSHSAQEPLTCHFCIEKFNKSFDLSKHLSNHVLELGRTCLVCGDRFSSNAKLQAHLYTHTRTDTFTCERCKDIFTCQCLLTAHIKTHSVKEAFACDRCTDTFSTASALQVHVDTHSKPRSYLCSRCGDSFVTEEAKDLHEDSHMLSDLGGITNTTCQFCGDRFLQNHELCTHLKSHTNKTNIFNGSLDLLRKQCECDSIDTSVERYLRRQIQNLKTAANTTSTTPSLKRKSESGSNNKTMSCSICNNTYINQSELMGHMETHGTGGKYCKKCCKGYIGSIAEHKQTHNNVTQGSTMSTQLMIMVGSEPYACNVCGEKYNELDDFKMHLQSHSKDGLYLCMNCGKISESGGDFVCDQCGKETNATTEEGGDGSAPTAVIYYCVTCRLAFENEEMMQEHQSTHESNSSYDCEHCGKIFGRKESLTRHKKVRHPNKFFCAHCDIASKDADVIVEHLTREHSGVGDPKLCTVCRKGFVDEIEDHAKTHVTSQQIHSCHVCGENFKRKFTLKKHLRKHGIPCPEMVFSCDVCGLKFKTEKVALRHRESHAANAYRCNQCDRAFDMPRSLLVHVRRMHSAKGHCCEYCGKMYASQKSLDGHVITHRKELPFYCTLCGKGFGRAQNLKVHMQSHTQERPYLCEHCGKGFQSKGGLQDHGRIHTGERPFVCSLCGSAFKDGSTLKKHIRSHTGERPYVCGVCGKGHRCSSTLANHMTTHTDARPYNCNSCSMWFKTRGTLQKHVKFFCSQGGARKNSGGGGILLQKSSATIASSGDQVMTVQSIDNVLETLDYQNEVVI